jgi:hypothetical protein
VIPSIMPYLAKSELWTNGRAGIDDILGFLYTGRMSLWLVYDENLVGRAFVITEIKAYPRCKLLVIQYCAGEPHHMKFVEEKMHDTLESYAEAADCAGIEFFGRPGWGAHVKKRGYDVQTVVYQKFFGDKL